MERDHGPWLEPPPRPWRISSRLLVVNEADRILLIHAHDPFGAAGREWWEVPGGGVEQGEDTAGAAVRETAEETGFVVPRDEVGPACWYGESTYVWARRRYWASLVMHLARVGTLVRCGPLERGSAEESSFLAVQWVPVADVVNGARRFFPGSLPTDLPRLLVGETVRAPFSVWS